MTLPGWLRSNLSAMPRRSRWIRPRHVLFVLSISLAYLYFFSPRRDAVSISAASIIQWSAEFGRSTGLPPLRASDLFKSKPPPPPLRPKAKSHGSGSKASKANDHDRYHDEEFVLEGGDDQPTTAAMDGPGEGKLGNLGAEFHAWRGPGYKSGPKPPYKPEKERGPPVSDPFPLLSMKSRPKKSLLQPPAINRPPPRHFPDETPLLIGFTRNWPQLLQCVVSYIAAGWPPEDIHVVENTGVMRANRDGKLSLQNPFYLNHTQLAMLGVDVITTPTLFSFAQLQNFYAWTALERGWTEYFWSHQDVLVFSYENEVMDAPYMGSSEKVAYSLYARAVSVLQYLKQDGVPKWANHFFAYDHLTLVHRDAILDNGGWDTHIPFYATDCDMYVRLMWEGYWQGETDIGLILDVSTVLDDLGALFRIPGVQATFAGDPGAEKMAEDEAARAQENHEAPAEPRPKVSERERRRREAEHKKHVKQHGETWERLVELGHRMQAVKYYDGGSWRNEWQMRQSGGKGEPFYRDPEGFSEGLQMLINTGRNIFAEKWGHRGCDIAQLGILPEDAWKLEKDWDPETEGAGYEGMEW